jgi:hypothetical protein
MPTREPKGLNIEPNSLDDSAFDEWETVSRDFGYKVEWGLGTGQTEVFVGQFLGLNDVPATDGSEDVMTAAEFLDSAGAKAYCWASFALRDAVENDTMRAGDTVRIKYAGEQQTKRGLNPVKKLTIQVKPRD